MKTILITQTISISKNELKFEFIRASGPGGQNVNKVATAVQLHFNITNSSLPDDVQERLIKLAGKRYTNDGEIIIEAKRYRAQIKNRQDALNRLIKLIQKAEIAPTIRKIKKPSKIKNAKRLQNKLHQSNKKQFRQKISSSYIE